MESEQSRDVAEVRLDRAVEPDLELRSMLATARPPSPRAIRMRSPRLLRLISGCWIWMMRSTSRAGAVPGGA